jgi:hypothetical protein
MNVHEVVKASLSSMDDPSDESESEQSAPSAQPAVSSAERAAQSKRTNRQESFSEEVADIMGDHVVLPTSPTLGRLPITGPFATYSRKSSGLSLRSTGSQSSLVTDTPSVLDAGKAFGAASRLSDHDAKTEDAPVAVRVVVVFPPSRIQRWWRRMLEKRRNAFLAAAEHGLILPITYGWGVQGNIVSFRRLDKETAARI